MAGEDRRTAREALGLEPPRALPNNIECEQAVLGSLLLHNESYMKCADILTKECFFEQMHQQIYEVIVGLIPQGKTANLITLKTYLGDPDLGGATLGQYLARLRTEAALPINVREYAILLNDLLVRRQMISIAQDMQELAYNAPVTATSKSMVDGAMDQLAALRTDPGATVSDFETFESASHRAVLAAQEAYQQGGNLVGTSTGIPRLDDAIGGLQKTDLLILAGRPAMGKTSLATNIAFNVAKMLQARRDAGEKVGVVAFNSLEMSSEQLSQRIISEQSGVPMWKIKRGLASQAEMERYVIAQRELRKLPISIDQTGELTIAQLRMRAMALKKKRGLDLLVVDYLQLLKGTSKSRDGNRVQEVTEITTGLKALAKDLNVPVIALSQLSRKVEERDDKRPMLADLRESGSIEQDADIVMFVYREEYYLKKQKPPQENTEARLNYDMRLIQAKGVAEVIVGKNRHGPEATVELGFDSNVTKFLNEPEEREMAPETPSREKARREKAKTLPRDATTLYGLLRGLTNSEHSVVPTDALLAADRKLKKNARVIPWQIARDKFAHEINGPDRDEDKDEALFRNAMKALRATDHALWTGTKETGGYVWIPNMTGN